MKNKKCEKANLENKRNLFFLIGLVISLAMVLMAFEWKSQQSKETIIFGNLSYDPPDDLVIPRTKEKKIEMPKPIIKVPFMKIVENTAEIDESIELMSSEIDDDGFIDFSSEIFNSITTEEDKVEDIPFIVDEMPEFPGGENALLAYLSRNVKYPVIAQENGIQGKVYISFVIDEEGRIRDAYLLRGVDVSLNNEALRVVRGMPMWKPGRQGGKAVKVRYNVPINFELR